MLSREVPLRIQRRGAEIRLVIEGASAAAAKPDTVLFSNGSMGIAGFERYRRLGCLRSLRAHVARDRVSRVQGGLVEVAVYPIDRMLH